MQNFSFKRLTAWLLALVMVFSIVPANVSATVLDDFLSDTADFFIKKNDRVSAFGSSIYSLMDELSTTAEPEADTGTSAEKAGTAETPIDAAIFFADLHTEENDYKESVLKGVVSAIKTKVGAAITSVTSCGDAFSVNENTNAYNGNNPYVGSTTILTDYIQDVLGDSFDINAVNYVWSDHDRYALKYGETASSVSAIKAEQLLDKTSRLVYGAGKDGIYGNADDANYYVYALSMADVGTSDRYSAGFSSDTAAAEVIADFIATAKTLNQDRPLFIASHMPLHDKRDDNGRAYDWFVAISEVAESMDVVFFHGHNHKHDTGNDYYFGIGDSMNVCSDKAGNAKQVTLNFTYMNAGYLEPTSTLTDPNGQTNARLGTAMAVAIYEDKINITTYDADGVYTGNYAQNVDISRAHAAAEPESVTVTDTATGISVSAPGLTGVTAAEVTNQAVLLAAAERLEDGFVALDINIEGTLNGTASVTMPIPDGMNAARFCVYYFPAEGEPERMPGQASEDGKTYTFTTNHFSVYVGGEMEAADLGTNPETGTGNLSGATTYTRATSITSEKKYLIASGNTENVRFLSKDGGRSGNTNVANIANLTYIDDYLWTVTAVDGGYTFMDSDKEYMYPNASYNRRWSYSLVTDGGSETPVQVTGTTNGAVTISRSVVTSGDNNTTSYLRYNNGYTSQKFEATGTSSTVYLYEQNVTEGTGVTFKLKQPTSMIPSATQSLVYEITLDNGTTVNSCDITWTSNNESAVTVANGVLTSKAVTASAEATITAKLTKVNGTALITPIELDVIVPVTVKTVASAVLSSASGKAERGSNTTDTTLLVTYTDGTTDTIPVTVDMIAGTYDINKNGTYSGLTVTYGGFTAAYTLNVVNITGVNDFPAYPNPGSVDVSKTASGLDFQNTGLAKVELSTSGLPAKAGADVIIMLDTSSSMNSNKVGNTNTTRLAVLQESLKNLIKQFKTSGPGGTALDLKVAIADFNGYYGSLGVANSDVENGTPYDRTTGDSPKGTKGYDQESQAKVYTNTTNALDETAFVDVEELKDTYTLNYVSGTNYDYAFDAIYQLGNAIKKANGSDERPLYVIFMTDGAALQWNYFHTPNDAKVTVDRTAYGVWNYWLKGTLDELPNNTEENKVTETYFASDDHAYYYDPVDHNGDGLANEHRMANAIKGDPNSDYTIIRKTTEGLEDELTAVTGYSDLWTVKGLGATMYAINFDAKDDGVIDAETTIDPVVRSLASTDTAGTPLYYKVQTATQLDNAFTAIGKDIAYAASNARFVDQLGSAFELQMNPVQWSNNSQTSTVENSTDITITTHAVYTEKDLGKEIGGHTVTADDIGKPYGDITTLEKVSFVFADNDGKTPTPNNPSDDVLSKVVSTVKGNNVNILVDGVICAEYFFYNTTSSPKNITLADGSTYLLPGETFYWNIGRINEKQFTLTYTVYLTGALDEGAPAADSYATNNFAILYYDNYVGNEVSKSVASPTIAWDAAKVSYAFYLVDGEGNPVYHDGSRASNFNQAYKVTQPVVYSVVKLNQNINLIAGPLAAEVLPEGYTLYAPNVSYKVGVASGNAAGAYHSYWTITNGNNATYVTGYDNSNSDAYTADIHVTTDANEPSDYVTGYDFTNTIVWFPVIWVPSTIPDQVVIDYGIPVDINVLYNDQFGSNGTLTGLCTVETALALEPENSETVTLQNLNTIVVNPENKLTTSNLLNLAYGTAKLENGMVRYTPSNMIMESYDRFVYEVKYTIGQRLDYYYGTVTVIPATNIYYEEKFLTFYDSAYYETGHTIPSDLKGTQIGQWKLDTDGTASSDPTQGEDRPGQFSLPQIDANNIYGYDAAYDNYKQYSLGSAAKVTVDKETAATPTKAPYAQFTFTGSGFDIVSLTDYDSGVIRVQVFAGSTATGTPLESIMINNFYGCDYGFIPEFRMADGTRTTQVYDSDHNLLTLTSDNFDKNGKVTIDVYDKAGHKLEQVQDFYVANSSKGCIYQVPVIKMDLGTYGTYTVKIQVAYLKSQDMANDGSYSFWMDAVRIYNPAGSPTSGVIGDAYKSDKESNPYYLMIKEAILSRADLDNLSLDIGGTLNGTVFIDGKASTSNAADYSNPGPNNEAYLAPGQSISFKLTADAKPSSVHIGVKLAFGESANVSLGYDGKTVATRTFNTATDMYYSIMDYLTFDSSNTTKTITLTNTSNTTAVVSLTNIKATFENAGSDVSGSDGYTPSQTRMNFLVDDETLAAAYSVMSALFTPEVFVPEVLEYTVSSGLFGYRTVNVITSKDVASLTVNGKEAQKLNDSKLFGTALSLISRFEDMLGINFSSNEYYIWTVSTKSANTYEIVAYDADGLSSDPSTADSNTSISKEDIAGFLERSEVFGIMEMLAERIFTPEYFETYINDRLDGSREIIAYTSEDVDYVVIDGQIVNRFITETVVDLANSGAEEVKRVWIAEADTANDADEPSVVVYDDNGIGSDAKISE